MTLFAARWGLLPLLLLAPLTIEQSTVEAQPAAAGKGETPKHVDLQGDPIPADARMRLGSIRFREPNFISAASLSPDGKTLAVSANSQSVRFIDVATGKEIRRLNVQEYIQTNQIFFTPDGKQIVTSGYNGISFFSVQDGKRVRQLPVKQRNNPQGSITLSEDGKFIALGSMYVENGTANVIEVEGNKQVASVTPVASYQSFVSLSPNGKTLATWGQFINRNPNPQPNGENLNRVVQIWDVASGKEKHQLKSESQSVSMVKFSPDGLRVATSGPGVIELWDVATGKLERRFAGRNRQVIALLFSRDGKQLSAGMQDGTVQMWDAATGKRLGICEGMATTLSGLQYRPDGIMVAWGSCNNAVSMWEVPSSKRLTPVGGHSAAITSLLFGADGKTLYSASQDSGMLRWDLATGKEEDFLAARGGRELRPGEVRRGPAGHGGPVVFAPNGKYFVAGGAYGNAVYDMETGLELFGLVGQNGANGDISMLRFSPDSSKVISGYRVFDNRGNVMRISIWDLETGATLSQIKGLTGEYTHSVFSSDGKLLAGGSYSYPPAGGQVTQVAVWDADSGNEIAKFQRNGPMMGMSFLDHRQLLVSFGTGYNPMTGAPIPGSMIVYDLPTKTELRTFEYSNVGNLANLTSKFALSPDGRLIAAGLVNFENDRISGYNGRQVSKIRIWETATGTVRTDLSGHEGTITTLAFSPDGKTLASGSSDTTILLWDLGRAPSEKLETLSSSRLDDLFKTLGQTPAGKAEQASRLLIAHPAESIPALKERVKPVLRIKYDQALVSKKIAELDSKRFVVREAAARELERIGRPALPTINETLKGEVTADLRDWLTKIRAKVDKPETGEDWLLQLRGIEVLERIGTTEAKGVLTEIAEGAPEEVPTRAAKSALARLQGTR